MLTHVGTGARCCGLAAGCVVVLIGVTVQAASMGWTKTGEMMLANRDGSNPQQVIASSSCKEVHFDEVTGQWFWMEYDAIKRANFDGSNVQTVVSDTLTSSNVDFDIDSTNGRIYWTNNAGQLRRANFDGSSNVILRSDLAAPYAITVDPSNNKVFWTDYSVSTTIYASDLSGNGKVTIGFLDSLWRLADMDVDPVAQQIYWVGSSSFRNEMVQRHGYSYNYQATTLIDAELGVVYGLTLDLTTDTMLISGTGGIMEANTNGNGLATIYNGAVGTPLHVAVSSRDVPEPASLVLLGLASLSLLRRHKE